MYLKDKWICQALKLTTLFDTLF